MKNPISLEALEDWLRKQNPNTTYRYSSPHGCLLFRYFTSLGLPVDSVGPHDWFTFRLEQPEQPHPYPSILDQISRHGSQVHEQEGSALRTYGGALEAIELHKRGLPFMFDAEGKPYKEEEDIPTSR